ncbi:MAG: helix-turn-helix transcriptional regulator [Oligoflexia bacterium]|nr:helix-turn-helix transcriptional regulator [Oligoflexia bacterium]
MNKKRPKLKIKAALQEHKMSQYQLANLMGLQTQHITNMVKPGYNPTFNTLVRISDAIGCKVRDLIEEG